MSKTVLRLAMRGFKDFEDALKEEFAAYERLHPEVSVELVPMALGDLYDRLFTQGGLAAGTCDIGLLVTDWLGEGASRGLLEELTPHMHSAPLAGWPEGWSATLSRTLAWNGGQYAIPWHDGPECLVYRRDLFEDAREKEAFRSRFGRELAPPATWDEFSEVAAFFTRPETDMYGCMVAAAPDGHNTLYDLTLQLWSRSGELADPDGRPTLDSPEMVASIEFYRNLIADRGRCFPGAAEIDSIQSGDVFLSGKVAMMANWFGFAARCDKPVSPLAGRVSVAAVPGEQAGGGRSLSVFWALSVAAGSRHKAEAWNLIRFLAGTEMDRGIVRHGPVAVRLSTWRDAELQKQIPVYAELEQLSKSARSLPVTAHLPALARIFNTISTQALTTSMTSEQIAREAQARAVQEGLALR